MLFNQNAAVDGNTARKIFYKRGWMQEFATIVGINLSVIRGRAGCLSKGTKCQKKNNSRQNPLLMTHCLNKIRPTECI